jgi:CDP-diacylglycerol--glycerol-3-phosphate 3-phosphatidyltransferase
MNLPNKLTIFRIALIPVVVILLYCGFAKIAAGVFALAAVTDAIDGHIARSRNMVTDFGKIMDPLADKLLVVSSLIVLVDMGMVPAWMLIVIFGRDFLVEGIRTVGASRGIVIAAGWSGKIKTVLQMLAVVAIMLGNWPFSLMHENARVDYVLLYLALLMTVYSGIDYVVKNRGTFIEK